jgi:DNA-directed RNA polymerase specialized sigma24 family protein
MNPGNDENYWTRPYPLKGITDPLQCAKRRVRIWLNIYPQLAASCYLGCRLDARQSPEIAHSSGLRNTTWAELVCIKADLDRAIATLPERWQTVMYLHFREGYLQREIGQMMKCNQQKISSILARGVVRMAAHLHIPSEDENERDSRAAGLR